MIGVIRDIFYRRTSHLVKIQTFKSLLSQYCQKVVSEGLFHLDEFLLDVGRGSELDEGSTIHVFHLVWFTTT